MIVDDDELSDIGLSIANDFREKVIVKKYFNQWKERVIGSRRANGEGKDALGLRIRSYWSGSANGVVNTGSKSKQDLDKEAKYLQNKINQLNSEIKRLQMAKNKLMYQRIFVFMFIFIILFLVAFLIFTFYFRFFTKIQASSESDSNGGDDDLIDFQEHFILLFLWILSILILSGITLRLFFSRPQLKKTKQNAMQINRITKHKILKQHMEENDVKYIALDELIL